MPTNKLMVALLMIAASMPARPASTADWQADIDVLERAYTQIHPGLYRYNTPEQMAQHFAELRRALNERTSVGQAFVTLSQFAAKVRCGHTYPNFYNQPESIAQALFEGRRRVPFLFRWIEQRMIVTHDQTGRGRLPLGTEVLAIDGVPVQEILRNMLTIARADGSNDAKRVRYVELQGLDRYEAFDVYLPLFYPQLGERMRLTVRLPGETQTRELRVRGITRAQRQLPRAPQPGDGEPDTAGWRLTVRDDDVAVLSTPNWALYRGDFDWQAFLRDAFARLQHEQVRHLVIDIRANEGGLDVGNVLLAHLSATPVTLPVVVRRTRYRATPVDLRAYLDTWDPSFHDWGASAQPIGEGWYRLLREGESAEAEVIAPRQPHFGGRTYVLIGAVNSSATFEFARAVKQSGAATLVGQTTGGNLRGINGGAFFFVRLPNSRIELDLPLVAQFAQEPQPDRGVLPDIAVTPTVADVIAGRDVELDAVLRDIAQRASAGN